MSLELDVKKNLETIEKLKAACVDGELTIDDLDTQINQLTAIFKPYGPSVEMLNYRTEIIRLIEHAIKCNVIGPAIGGRFRDRVQNMYSEAGAHYGKFTVSTKILFEFCTRTETGDLKTWDPIRTYGTNEVLNLNKIINGFQDYMHTPEFVRKLLSKVSANYTHYLETGVASSLNNAISLLNFMVDIKLLTEAQRTMLGTAIASQSETLIDSLNQVVLDGLLNLGKDTDTDLSEHTSKFGD